MYDKKEVIFYGKGFEGTLVASESAPFVKSGGLGDVVGSLPKALQKKNVDVRVVIPRHRVIKNETMYGVEFLGEFDVYLQWRKQRAKVLVKPGEVPVYFIENDYYFSRGALYGFDDDNERFAFFGKAVLDMLAMLDFYPDVIHCNDWQTGLIPVYLKERFSQGEFYQGIKSIMTIHNLKFQGIWDLKKVKDITGLPDEYFTSDKLEAYDDANYLKGGIVYADRVTTVSETYAEEIKTPFYGENLDGLMRARANVLSGIVNGIDYDEYNPETDKRIANNYNQITFRKEKWKNKVALQKELGLTEDKGKFMIGLVSRLTDQKGLDLVAYVMDQLCAEDVQFVILGTGEERYENMFRHYDWKYNDRVSANIYYSEDMSHKVYASCDAFLMPSLFEPCGLSQLMSLRYGTVPIVRETGGLKDTVEPYNEYEGKGTGFSFANYNAHEMLSIVNYAKDVYYNHKREWNKIVDRGMKTDFSWNSSARKYEDLYNSL